MNADKPIEVKVVNQKSSSSASGCLPGLLGFVFIWLWMANVDHWPVAVMAGLCFLVAIWWSQ